MVNHMFCFRTHNQLFFKHFMEPVASKSMIENIKRRFMVVKGLFSPNLNVSFVLDREEALDGDLDAAVGLVCLVDTLRHGLPPVSHRIQAFNQSPCGYATR